MAYKGRRIKKKPLYKKPGFWMAIGALVLIRNLYDPQAGTHHPAHIPDEACGYDRTGGTHRAYA